MLNDDNNNNRNLSKSYIKQIIRAIDKNKSIDMNFINNNNNNNNNNNYKIKIK